MENLGVQSSCVFFFLGKMMMQMTFMLVKFLLVLSSLSVQGSAGAAPMLSHFEVGKLNLGFYRTSRAGLILEENARALSPSSSPTFFGWNKDDRLAVQAPQFKEFHNLSPTYHSPTKGVSPTSSPLKHPVKEGMHGSASSPSVFVHKNHHKRNKFSRFTPKPHYYHPPPIWQGPSFSPSQSPIPSPKSWSSPVPMPSEMIPSSQFEMPPTSPAFSPLSPYLKTKKNSPPPSSVLTLPPPPPNHDCTSLTCTAPLTYSPPGSPCGCVWPIEVSLRLSIPLYTFFPLVTELAKEIAATIALNRSQVRIMGANAANQQLDKTIVLVNLLPQYEKFDATSAFSIYKKFWKREVSIMTSNFGNYKVLYVRYPGLPPSPPSLSSSAASINDHGSGNDGTAIKPLGVDVPRRKHNGRDRNMIVIVVLSSVTAFVVCMGFLWLLLLKCGFCTSMPKETPQVLTSSQRKLSGAAGSLILGSRASSTMSHTSSTLAYSGTAKVFSISDIERATDNFDASRILGEGGFGLVYHGILDNGTKVAVKVLKREDQQGGREFLAEVEMLGRLHHRNLVKLIGICTEAHCRCLVYELVPNGSVESHLHGIDKEASPLDWSARMKIALGAARGLAYLHEDSSPRVIHRDFKSSNILLENDFTPKVSDFGLARAAQDEGNKHISTHVMGTFGYLAPEYAMTGHLLVKSDVYSYGVVLLELVTGRKPVDLSRPPGQENLVAWARPLLATKEGTEIFLDAALKSYAPVDGVAKVAAIASMCVQPEVSHRPFMGEVVQALTLVCNEFDETRETVSRSCSQEDFSIDMDGKQSRVSGELVEASQPRYKMSGYDTDFNANIALSATDLKNVSAQRESDSFRRQFNSAPLKMGRKRHFWQRLKFLPRGSMSEHGFSWKL